MVPLISFGNESFLLKKGLERTPNPIPFPTFPLQAGDYGTSAVVMALYPLPVLAGSTYLLVKVLLLPHPNIRRIFYEVSRGPKVYKK